MNVIDLTDLANEDLVFNNENRPEEEAFSIELCDRRSEARGDNFHLWVNGELVATFKTFKGLATRAAKLIATHNLERVA